MKLFYIILVFTGFSGCKSTEPNTQSSTIPEYIELVDKTLAVDSKQGGNFEITVLPSQLNGPMESNMKATKDSKIELLIDKQLKITVSNSEVIRVQGLSNNRHSIVELVDGTRTFSFFVDGSQQRRVIADYYEVYGNWIIRDPITSTEIKPLIQ